MPWNWKTPIGYMIAVCIQYSWIAMGIFMVTSCLIQHAGVCILAGTFAMDIKENLVEQNDIVLRAEGNYSAEQFIEMKENLCNIIQFHCDVKQLSIDVNLPYTLGNLC